jgi:hypothetical protein
MNKAEWHALGEYLRAIADMMGLRDWHLDLSHEPSAEEPNEDGDITWGKVSPVEGRKKATIRLGAGFRGLPPYEQREIVVHELAHCHLRRLADVTRVDLPACKAISQVEYDCFWRQAKREVEHAVDAISSNWARRLPLPKWPQVKRKGASVKRNRGNVKRSPSGLKRKGGSAKRKGGANHG